MTGSDVESQLFLIAEGLGEQIKALRLHGQAELDGLAKLVEARLHERDRLMDERFHDRDLAITVASAEREKAAAALREALARTINDGDDRLREHIETQISQIKGDHEAADKLEVARVSAVETHVNALARELGLVISASDKAIAKADAATERRFESVNEFRAQLGEQTASFLSREVFDATIAQLTEWRTAVDRDRARIVGATEQRTEGRLSQGSILGIAGFALAVLGTIIVLANFAFAHSNQTPNTPVWTIPDLTPRTTTTP